MFEYFNGYWNWAGSNPSKVNPTSSAIYFYILSVANELHWRETFGLSATQIMNGVNIATYKTYKKHFDELIDNGLIKVVQPSINQYKCNVIALVKFTEAQTIARPKHGIEHDRSTNQGTTHIHKTIKEDIDNKEYKEVGAKKAPSFKHWDESHLIEAMKPLVEKYSKQTCNAFFSYWTEPLPNGKIRLTAQGAWDTNRRLSSWKAKESSSTSFSKPIQPTFSRAANGVHFSGTNPIES